MKRALISVFNKEGLESLAKALQKAGYELVASGGTAEFVERRGLSVTPVETITGNPEAFQGRMKTLSFQMGSAILYDRNNPSHQKEAEALHLTPIDVVVCNFYPFERAVQENLPLEKAVELIDIGGPALIRAAAKNFEHVVVLADPEDYPEAESYLLSSKEIPKSMRFRLAAKAFQKTAEYESLIDFYFQEHQNEKTLRLQFRKGKKLRYGENPHQEGTVFWGEGSDSLSLERFTQISGKDLSFNNFLDLDSAVNTLALVGGEKPACVIVKHGNPCGAAVGNTEKEAFRRAWEGDPIASFGGVAAFNRTVTSGLVQQFLEEKKFAEIFLAPDFEPDAVARIAEKKKNMILLVNPALFKPVLSPELEIKKIRGGVLTQNKDFFLPKEEDLEAVSERKPNPQEIRDLLFAWKIGKESRSNSVILARQEQLVGSGVGQQDRLRACRLAVEKAGDKAAGSVAASDGFFPFPDSPEILIRAGVTAILHPGGSLRDSETTALCNRHQVALVTSKGIRAFKH